MKIGITECNYFHLGHLMNHIIPFSNSPGQPLGHLMDYIIPFSNSPDQPMGYLIDHIIPFMIFDDHIHLTTALEKNYISVEIELLIIYISNDNILISLWKYN